MSTVELVMHSVTCGLRPLGLLMVLPLGWDLLGVSARISIATALAVFLAPHVVPIPHIDWMDFILEILLGALLGLPAAILIECSTNIGEFFDILRGQSIASVYDPLQQQVSPLSGVLAKWVVWALLLGQGAAVEFARALLYSFVAAPLGSTVLTSIPGLGSKALLFIPKMLALMMTACLPFACACIAVEMLMVCISKQMPSLALSTEGMLAKSAIAIVAVLVTAQPAVAQLLTGLARPITNLLVP